MPPPQGPDKIKVGLLLDSLVEERWQRDRDLFVERVKELGGEAIVKAANRDAALQEQQARELLDQGVKALVIVAADTEKAAAIVAAAAEKKVPVISYDRLIRDADVALYVSFDNVKVGRMQAEYLLNQAPKGNYLLIGGSPTDNNAKLLRQGQMEMLKPAIAAGSVKIVGEGWADNWSEENAKALTEEALKKARNNLAAIVASNDRTAARRRGGADRAQARRQGLRLGAGRRARRHEAHRRGHAVDDGLQAAPAARAHGRRRRHEHGAGPDGGRRRHGEQRQEGRARAAARADLGGQGDDGPHGDRRRVPQARRGLRH